MKMTPEELESLLVDYLYDELDDATRARFEASLPDAPDLAAEVEAHKRTREAMNALQDVPVPSGLLDGVMAEAERQAAARAESEPSFIERILAGLMQPAALTLGLFFVLATTSYFLVAQNAGTPATDESLAISDPEPKPVDEHLEKEASAPVELEEKEEGALAPERPDPSAGADIPPESEAPAVVGSEAPSPAPSPMATRVKRQAVKSKRKQAGPARAVKKSLEKSPRKAKKASKAVAPGTVARLYTLETDEVAEDQGKADSSPYGGAMRRAARQNVDARDTARKKGEGIQVHRAPAREEREAARARPEVARQSATTASAPPPVGAAAEQEPAPAPRAAVHQAPRDDNAGAAQRQAERRESADEAEQKRSPWQEVVAEASRQKKARAKAGVWLRAYDRFAKSGRKDLARRALDQLAKVPGYQNVAKEKRRALAKSAKGGGPTKAPAAKKRSKKKVAPSKSKAPVKKK